MRQTLGERRWQDLKHAPERRHHAERRLELQPAGSAAASR
jgi:hypothetical protein